MWEAIHSMFAPRSPRARMTVIGAVTGEQDRRLLAGLASRNGWEMSPASTFEEAWAAVVRTPAPVVLCDRDLPGPDWRDALRKLASAPGHASVILVSRVVDEYLWSEVIRNGGYDVLSKPLREDEAVRMVKLAWTYWNSALAHYRRVSG
jgi:DNA-binding NtrC family response regulator